MLGGNGGRNAYLFLRPDNAGPAAYRRAARVRGPSRDQLHPRHGDVELRVRLDPNDLVARRDGSATRGGAAGDEMPIRRSGDALMVKSTVRAAGIANMRRAEKGPRFAA